MRYLVTTASVHTSAAACDYLSLRVDDDDTVVGVHVATTDDPVAMQEGQEALNVLRVRLAALTTVRTEQLSGVVAEEVLGYAADADVDEIVIGARGGAPGSSTDVGSTAERILTGADRPVVAVPLEDL